MEAHTLGYSHRVAALLVFLFVYSILLLGRKSPRKLDRPAAGLIGAVALIVTGVLTRAEAVAAIDFGTLALLFGMMVLVHFLRSSGLLDELTNRVLARCTTPHRLLWAVCASAAVLSALFVNDTICLLMTPLVLDAAERRGLSPEPYLIALATSSNCGSVMTLTGNPQNMLVGHVSGWTWTGFAERMVPLGLAATALNALLVAWIYRKALAVPDGADGDTPVTTPLDRKLASRTAIVFAAMFVAFLLGAPLDVTALAAAAAILVLANRPPEEAFASVDWGLLIFFGGLFIVVDGIVKANGSHAAGILEQIARVHTTPLGLAQLGLTTVIGGNLFSNVPFVLLLVRGLAGVAGASTLWLMVAASSTFSGNLTMLGSVANMIVAQEARKRYSLSFWAFLRVGATSSLLTVALGAVYIGAMHAAGLA